MVSNKDLMWLFVYGTLKKGFPLYTGQEELVKEDAVVGTLYNLGSYPALRLGGSSIVYGEIHLVSQTALKIFDYIEGGQYIREEIVTLNGVTAFTYVYKWPLPDNKIIHSGVWDAFS